MFGHARPRRRGARRGARRRARRGLLRGGRDRAGRRRVTSCTASRATVALFRVNLGGRTVLVTGATGGLGHAIARGLAARGATARPHAAAAPSALERARRRARRPRGRRRPRRPGRASRACSPRPATSTCSWPTPAPGQRRARQLHARGDRPRARGQPARADRARAAADRAAWPRAAAGSSSSCVAVGQGGRRRARRVYSATKFGLRGFAQGCARTCAEPASACRWCSRASSATPGCSPTPAPSCRRASARARRRRSPRPSCGRSSATAREVDVAPLPLRVGARIASLAPGLTAGVQARLGSFDVARDIGAGQRDKR